jgi:hypothetical protein
MSGLPYLNYWPLNHYLLPIDTKLKVLRQLEAENVKTRVHPFKSQKYELVASVNDVETILKLRDGRLVLRNEIKSNNDFLKYLGNMIRVEHSLVSYSEKSSSWLSEFLSAGDLKYLVDDKRITDVPTLMRQVYDLWTTPSRNSAHSLLSEVLLEKCKAATQGRFECDSHAVTSSAVGFPITPASTKSQFKDKYFSQITIVHDFNVLTTAASHLGEGKILRVQGSAKVQIYGLDDNGLPNVITLKEVRQKVTYVDSGTEVSLPVLQVSDKPWQITLPPGYILLGKLKGIRSGKDLQ